MGNKNRAVIIILLVGLLLIGAACIIWANWNKISSTVAAEFEVGNPMEHPNYAGVLQISSVGIKVPLVLAEDSETAKFVVDKVNCAVLIKDSDRIADNPADRTWLIGDHNYQRFRNLPRVEVGAEATITNPDGTIQKYVVTDKFIGYNAGSDMIYENGTSIWNDNEGGITLYTCVDGTGVPVHIVFLQPV